jgi:glycosyltransferase involved in cell wall biosynthesis
MRKIKVALLINEFFDNSLKNGSGYGGYGMLGRHYIAEHLPDNEIELETILGFNNEPTFHDVVLDGRKKVTLLPNWGTSRGNRLTRRLNSWRNLPVRRNLKRYLNRFDVFLSIETTPYMPSLFRFIPKRKLILYVQDPRPQSEWDELDTVFNTDDGSPRPDASVSAFYRDLNRDGRLVVISQGIELIQKARDLYNLPSSLQVQLVRNPVTIDEKFDLRTQTKENAVIWLGRLDPVKRPWLALEVAKRMPDVQFYFLGVAHDKSSQYIIYPYQKLPNVHLLGQQSGSVKWDLLKRCKLLINPSIHEAIPVSFLEALAYGVLLVSCQNPDSIVERFGAFTGKILGDGRDQADLFVKAIESILDDEAGRQRMANEARAYVSEHHNLPKWIRLMRDVIRKSSTVDTKLTTPLIQEQCGEDLHVPFFRPKNEPKTH